MKAVCLQKCKNGGECVGPNTCHCPAGWEGLQCQTRKSNWYISDHYTVIYYIFNLSCGGFGLLMIFWDITMRNTVPLNTALCKRKCQNGGKCVLPNFCQCRSGYTGSTCAARVSWVSLYFFSIFRLLLLQAILWKYIISWAWNIK